MTDPIVTTYEPREFCSRPKCARPPVYQPVLLIYAARELDPLRLFPFRIAPPELQLCEPCRHAAVDEWFRMTEQGKATMRTALGAGGVAEPDWDATTVEYVNLREPAR